MHNILRSAAARFGATPAAPGSRPAASGFIPRAAGSHPAGVRSSSARLGSAAAGFRFASTVLGSGRAAPGSAFAAERGGPAGIALAAAAGGSTNAAMPAPAAAEFFPALDALPGVRAAFLTRIPGIDVATDRETALARLAAPHDALIAELGFSPPALAGQVHGNFVALLGALPGQPIAAADGLATADPGLTLGIYVADCAAVYLVDPVRRAIALVHSGRKGTESNILGQAVARLREGAGSCPADLVAVVSPCIRPPHYEVDFAATIAEQARAAGIRAFHDAGTCTAAHPDRYYSYRRELGRTGRMLALLALR